MKAKSSKNTLPLFILSWRRILLIIMVTVLCALIGLLYSALKVEPIYTASRSVILRTAVDIDDKPSSVTNNATLAKIYLPVVSETIKSPKVIEKANEQYTKGTISAGAINVEYGELSLIFKISYSDASKKGAEEKLEVLIEAVKEVISEQDVVNAQRATLIRVQTNANVEVRNDFFKYIVYGAAAGIILSLLILTLIYLLDNTVKDKQEFEESTGISVLAYIDEQKK